jgi:hypothetical protein
MVVATDRRHKRSWRHKNGVAIHFLRKARSTTARARQHVRRERPPHEGGPGPVAPRGRRRAARFGEVTGQHRRGRPTITHDLSAPACMQREDAVVDEQVDLGAGCQRGQLRQELVRLEHEMRRPIAPGPLQLDRHAPIGPEPQPVLGQRGAEQIAAQMLQPARSLGGTRTLACRSNSSKWAWRGPRAAWAGSVRSPRRRLTGVPGCWPSATRPWTEALVIRARTAAARVRPTPSGCRAPATDQAWRQVNRGHARPCG